MIRVHLKEVMKAYERKTGERLTYETLAKRTNLSVPTLQSIGARDDYNPRLSTIAALCEALDCSPSDLLVMDKKTK